MICWKNELQFHERAGGIDLPFATGGYDGLYRKTSGDPAEDRQTSA